MLPSILKIAFKVGSSLNRLKKGELTLRLCRTFSKIVNGTPHHEISNSCTGQSQDLVVEAEEFLSPIAKESLKAEAGSLW